MAKKIKTKVKVQVIAGQATPAPPLGTVLGPQGVNIMDFVSAFNEQTKDRMGTVLPVVITIYEDRSFDFITKQSPATELIKKELKIQKGSASSKKDKVAKLTKDQLRRIAEEKMPDLNANTVDQAEHIIAGTARSMGVEVEK